MLGSTVHCPKNLWTYAVTYAAQTLNFNPNRRVNTSSYNYETGLHVDTKYMQRFFSKVYLFIQKEKRLSKLGCPRAQLCHFLTYHFTTAFQPNNVVLPVLGPGKYGQIVVSKDVIFDDTIPYLTNNYDLYPTEEQYANIPALEPMVLQQLGPFPLVAPTVAPAPSSTIEHFPMIELPAAPVQVINDVPQYWTEDPQDVDILPSPPLPRPTTASVVTQFRDSPPADELPVSMNAVRDIGPPSVDHPPKLHDI